MSKFNYLYLYIIILQLYSSYQLNFKSFDIFKPNHIPYIQAHRGVNKEFPENTLRSFQNAIDRKSGLGAERLDQLGPGVFVIVLAQIAERQLNIVLNEIDFVISCFFIIKRHLVLSQIIF